MLFFTRCLFRKTGDAYSVSRLQGLSPCLSLPSAFRPLLNFLPCIMSHRCSRSALDRCVAPPGVALSDINFRGLGRQAHRLTKTCNYCRNAPLQAPSTPTRPQPKRRDPPSRPADPVTGLTPGASRALRAAQRPPSPPSDSARPDSPTPHRPSANGIVPDLTDLRPVRNRRAPRHFDSTPPTPPPAPARDPPAPRIRRPRPPATHRKCSGCHRRLEVALFDNEPGDRLYRTCMTCRNRTRLAHSSSVPPSSQRLTSPILDAVESEPTSPRILQPGDALDATYMDPAHVDLVQDFARKLEGLTMEHCALCKERWFNILDSRGRCKQCASRPGKFTSDNQMDPGE